MENHLKMCHLSVSSTTGGGVDDTDKWHILKWVSMSFDYYFYILHNKPFVGILYTFYTFNIYISFIRNAPFPLYIFKYVKNDSLQYKPKTKILSSMRKCTLYYSIRLI